MSKFFINYNFRLPDHCNAFQAEVVAIKVAKDVLPRSTGSFIEVCIHLFGRDSTGGALKISQLVFDVLISSIKLLCYLICLAAWLHWNG